MDELQTIIKARQFIRDAGVSSVPVDIDHLAGCANAKIKYADDLSDKESGQTTSFKGQHIIIVNGNHKEERQRFTVLHEIAHIVLELPSQHHGTKLTTDTLMRYGRRPQEEVLCDVFASECLLPYDFFCQDINDLEICMDSVKELAGHYKASLHATGSRFAVNASEPCTFVLIEDETIRYVSSSKHLRDMKGWIQLKTPVPKGSVAHRLCTGSPTTEDGDEVPTDIWFEGGVKNRPMILEESILMPEWNQCLSLLWFDEGAETRYRPTYHNEEDEPLLEELDGVLPWPGRSRRR